MYVCGYPSLVALRTNDGTINWSQEIADPSADNTNFLGPRTMFPTDQQILADDSGVYFYDYTGSVVGTCNLDGAQCPWVYDAAGYPIAAPSTESDKIYIVHHVPKTNLENEQYDWESVRFSAIPKSGVEQSTRSLPVEVNDLAKLWRHFTYPGYILQVMSFVIAFVVLGSVLFPIALVYRRDVYTHISDETEVRFRYLGMRKLILAFGFTLAAFALAFFAIAIAFSATDPTGNDFLNDPTYNQQYFWFRVSWPWWIYFAGFTIVAIGTLYAYFKPSFSAPTALLVTVSLFLLTLLAGFIALIVIYNTSLPASIDQRIQETGSSLYFRSPAFVAEGQVMYNNFNRTYITAFKEDNSEIDPHRDLFPLYIQDQERTNYVAPPLIFANTINSGSIFLASRKVKLLSYKETVLTELHWEVSTNNTDEEKDSRYAGRPNFCSKLYMARDQSWIACAGTPSPLYRVYNSSDGTKWASKLFSEDDAIVGVTVGTSRSYIVTRAGKTLRVYSLSHSDWSFNGPFSLNLPTDQQLNMSGEAVFNSDESVLYMHYFSTADTDAGNGMVNRVIAFSVTAIQTSDNTALWTTAVGTTPSVVVKA
eukprot:TRINITY_DN934_c0_g1_i1.p1 TRINITY_DN934_c0_g1~~TRINITY_DN934_c0_g1_i1.p1  ORF type:complete len:592 (-),score=171.23 TRINITY_DN934_c0_g1_i1:88-1863(-)